MQYQDSHISTCFNKKGTRDIYILYRCLCQLSVIHYLFICAFLFIINRSFILFIVQLFILFSFSSILCLFVVQKRKEQFWSWTVFRYFDPVDGYLLSRRSNLLYLFKYSTSSFRVNKYHTVDSTDFVLV